LPYSPGEIVMTYTVEPHGAGWALYKGRTNDRHGYRLCTLTDGDQAIYAAIADALNRAEAAEAVRVKAESNLQKVQIPTSTIPEGFIPWHGGECPVAGDTTVEVKLRNGVSFTSKARYLLWSRDGSIIGILAYRVHKPADFRIEAGKFYVTASGERVGPVEANDEHYDFPFSINTRGREADFTADGICKAWALPHPERNNILALSSNQESNHD
jgi:hypothetical protein